MMETMRRVTTTRRRVHRELELPLGDDYDALIRARLADATAA